MKTFDEAVESIISELKEPDLWHGNHCRCAEIDESHSLGQYTAIQIVNTFGLTMGRIDDKLIYFAKLCIELGIAIGQEMEKETYE